VWRRALDTAAFPTHKQVSNALRAHDTATGRTPTNKVAAYYQRTVKEEHKRGLRALIYIHDHGGEEALQAHVAAIQAQLDQWEGTADAADSG
jgi:creatinine amidohydrolase/Fe(II)-dependent formamide hydrolase-like protein